MYMYVYFIYAGRQISCMYVYFNLLEGIRTLMEYQFIHLVPYKLNFILYCFLLLGSFLLLRWNNGSCATPVTGPNNEYRLALDGRSLSLSA